MRHLILPMFAIALFSCAPRADLTPVAGPKRVGVETAIARVEGVAVRVRTDAWPGRTAIGGHVTPVRVTVVNEGKRDVRLRYDDFAIIAPDGRRYAAIPPVGVAGTASAPRLDPAAVPIGAPAFRHHRFHVAPYYATIYPSLPPYVGTYHYDPYYHGRYYDYWVTFERPTREMLVHALPEGVVRPGGDVSGFLYFEPVDVEDPRVTFRVDLVTEEGRSFGEIRIPLDVERAGEGTS